MAVLVVMSAGAMMLSSFAASKQDAETVSFLCSSIGIAEPRI